MKTIATFLSILVGLAVSVTLVSNELSFNETDQEEILKQNSLDVETTETLRFLDGSSTQLTGGYTIDKASTGLIASNVESSIVSRNVLGIIDCPGDTTISATTSCSAIATWDVPMSDISANSIVQSAGPVSGSSFNLGSTTITYEERDGSSNVVSTCSFTVTVVDDAAPTASNPADINVQCLADVPAADPSVVTTEADNCGTPTVTFLSQTADPTVNNGTITRTYVVDDGNGNTITVTQDININDTQNPTASNPADINVQCLADVPAADPSVVTTEADNCGTPTVTFLSQTADPTVNNGTITRTYVVDDGNGNTITVTQDININDTQNPTASNPADINVQCLADVPAADPSVVTTEADNCGTPTVTFLSQTADPTVNNGTITRTYVVDDGNGNTITVTQDININDTQNPTASNPADINVQCLADVPAADPSVVTTEADNCGTPTVTFLSQTADPTVNNGTITRTYVVDDGNGNTITVTQDININDTQNPTASNPADINVQCLADVPAADPSVVTTEADNCGTPTVTFLSQTADPTVNNGTITRTYVVDDGNGNTITVTQDININDTQNPTASNPADINVQCLADVPAADPSVVTTEADNCGTPTVTFLSQTADPTVNNGTITRTYVVDDGNGNTITVTQDININDTQNPTASNPADINVQCLADVPAADPSVVTTEADNCGTPTVTFLSQTADPTVNNGTITRTYVVDDGNGNTITVTQDININDTQNPTASNPADINVQCLADVPAADPSVVTTEADNCGTPTVTFLSQTADPTVNNGTITRTYVVDDGNGNTITVTQDININDTQNPTASNPADINVQCLADVPAADPSVVTTEADNCGTPTVTFLSQTADPTVNNGTITRTYVVDDGNGNTITVTQDININDTQNPTASNPADINVQCLADVPAADPSVVTTEADNCGTPTVTFLSQTADPTVNNGTITRTYVVDDGNGNTITVTQDININDTQNPTASNPADINVQCLADVPAADPSVVTTEADNCGTPTVTFLSQTADPTVNNGTITRTYVVDDGNGNTMTVTQDININDTTGPTPDVPTLDDVTAQCEVTALTPPTATDNCGGVVTVDNDATLPIISQGTTVVTWTYTDENGQATTQVQDIIIEDTTGPTPDVNILVDVTAQCEVTILTPPTATDNCGGVVTVTNDATLPITSQGTTVVTWTYTDENGQITTQTQDIVITDTIAPNAICQDITVQLDASGNAVVTADDADNGSTDNCGIESFSFTPGPVASGNIALGKPVQQSTTAFGGVASRAVDGNTSGNWGNGSITHTNKSNGTNQWWEVDLQGTFSISSMNIWNRTNCCSNRLRNYTVTLYSGATVVSSDTFTTAPAPNTVITTVTGSGDRVRVTNNINNEYLSIAEFQVYSNSGELSLDCSDLGDNDVVVYVRDTSGNESTCTTTITVEDTIDPTITCPDDVIVTIDDDINCEAATADVSLGTPVTADNCAVASVTSDAPTNFPIGDTIITWTVTDTSGNTATCTQKITVNDDIEPVITCPDDIVLSTDPDSCSRVVNYSLPTATDCSSFTITQIDTTGLSSGSEFPIGITTLEYQVLDAGNLLDTCSFTITIEDDQDPTITLPDSSLVQDTDLGLCSASIALNDVSFDDNCSGSAITWAMSGATNAGGTGTGQVPSPYVFNIGITTITYTVTDANGNTATDAMTVTVSDNELPVVVPPAALTVSAGVNCQISSLALGAPTTSDNCGVLSVTNNASPPFVVGTVDVEWIVTDVNGNSSSAIQQITVVDDIDPTLTLPSTFLNATTSTEGDFNCSVAVSVPAVTANDNCSGSILTWEMTGATNNGGTGTGQVSSPFIFNVGVTEIVYTVTDTATPANTISKTLTVTVLDDENPTISALSNISVSNDVGVCGASVSWTAPTANDNCAVSTFIQTTGYSNPFTFPIGTTTVTYEAQDASGNSIVSSFDVTVTDEEVPTISHPNQSIDLEATTSADGTGNCTVAIAIPDAIIDDNCGVSELRWVLTGATTGSGLNQVGTQLFNVGTSVITYTVSDTNSTALENTLSFTVIVTDDEIPSLNLPSDITVNSCDQVVSYPEITGNDNCGVASIIQNDTTGLSSGSEFPSGTTILEYKITDVNGLVFIDTFTITVIDEELPIVNCPSDVTFNTDAGLCTAKYDYQVVATDDCVSSPTLTWEMTGAAVLSGSGQIGDYDFPVGTTIVTFTVDDGGGNTDTCASTVTVIDNENPILTCPTPSASYNTDIDTCTTSLTFVAIATDNCDNNPTVAYSIDGTPIAFPYDFPIGNTEVDVTATASNGLTASCSFIVTVEDNQDPVLTCPTVAPSYPTDPGLCVSLLDLPATVTDNSCDTTATIVYTIGGSVIVFPYEFTSGSTVVTATADDGFGQTATCDYTVVVEDNESPIANCIGSLDITLSASGSASIEVSDINNLSTDNCGIQSIALDTLSFDCDDLGANTVTLTVTDTSGNSMSCETIVNVLDPASNSGVEINVDNNPICQDGDIEFTATPINGGSSPVYEWFVNDISQGTNSPNFVPFTSLNDGDEVYVKMQSSLSSCDAPIQSISVFVTVYPTPIVTAPADICLGSTDNVTANTAGTWSSSDPSIATVSNSGLVTALSVGVVEFIFTSATGGCDSTTLPVIVNALPVLTAPTTLCVSATDSVLPNSGGTWTSNNPTIATIDNTGTVTGVNVGFVSFTFVDTNGCANTTSSIEVLESPIIDAITLSTNPLCSGETVSMQATLQPLSNPSSQVTLVNYNFNLGNDSLGYNDYDGQEIPGIISDMNSSTMTYNYGYGGTNTGPGAFVPDPTTGDENSLRQRDDSGFDDDGDWIFDIGGSVLGDYRDFRVYFQTRRNNASGNPKYIDISYRINGTGSFVDLFRYDMPNNGTSTQWREVLFSLPPEVDNAAQLELKLYVNDGRNSNNNRPDVRIDNFQLQGTIGGDIVTYSWAADTGADAGLPASASVPSTGNSIIQVNPIVTTNYTLSVQNAANGCVDTETVTVAVAPSPDIFVTADYCPVDDPSTPGIDETNFVKLTATSDDPTVTYEWQTNPIQTGDVIYTDIADIFTVVATNAAGCSTEQTISIAEELVIDGDFTNLDVMDDSAYPFTSEQIFVPNQPGLVPANQGELWADGGLLGYTITEQGNDTHRFFRGNDHTNNAVGPQQFMAVNGDGGPAFGNQIDVWRQSNTPVLPNTTYYFSAWGLRLVNGSPPILQFKINGNLVGTTLTPPPINSTEDNWGRFYGTYTTGPTETTADIFIVNLNGSAGGNDFGLDDISFATLSTFIRLETELTTTVQTVCENTPIETISYAIGGGLDLPTIEWTKNGVPLGTDVFPGGVESLYNGSSYFISGAPTEFGVYEYELTTTSPCDVKTAEGTITIEEAPVVQIQNALDPVCYGDSSVVMTALLSGAATAGTWTSSSSAGSFTGVSADGATATYNFGATETSELVTLIFTSNDPSGICEAAVATYELELRPYILAEAGTFAPVSDCSETTVNLSANEVEGIWTVTSGQPSNSYSFTDSSSYNSSFTGESGEVYTLQWEAVNLAPCTNSIDTLTITFPDCGDNIDFDGTDDYISFANNYNMNSGPFSLEAWIKADNVTGSKTIISKRDADVLTTGYDLMLTGDRLRFRWNDNAGLISTQQLNKPKWYHVAVTFDGVNTYSLFVDGFNVGSTSSGDAPLASTDRFIIGASDRSNTTPVNFFGGAIDEVRIWDYNLTQTQIRQMMNQEIEANGTNVRGVVVPQNIDGLQWSDLMGYYQMREGSQSSIANGNIDDISSVLVADGTLNSMSSVQSETAPIPYVSINTGLWDDPNTWLNGADQQIPNSTVNSIDGNAQLWNIVQIQNNVRTNRSTIVQGLIVASNEFSVVNDEQLKVNSYLKIDGLLDLDGESQLLQPNGSVVDNTGTGKLERDQQGTSNLFNYNFWSSPVNDNGSTYSLSNVLKDASNPANPMSVNWTSSFNADGTTSPITLSRRWLYTYTNAPEGSSDWFQISELSALSGGQGYLMKGSGTSGLDFNYTFKGIPNNGDYTVNLSPNYKGLVGNPYPSALDGYLFITDNQSSLESGTLDFWEQAPSNNTHVTRDYLGGYAVLSLSGGIAAVTPPDGIAGVGDASKIPGRYIPVAQGFFVTANNVGGPMLFQNSQRAFVKEDSSSSVFLRPGTSDSEEDAVAGAYDFKRIRIDITNPENAVRHLLLAFTENGETTDGVDYGYDAPNNDGFPSDVSFDIDDSSYVIQGVDQFDDNQMFPLIVTLENDGMIQIEFDEFENFDEPIDLFIYDSLLGTYTQFNETSFQITLDAGTYTDRFFLAFQEDQTLSVVESEFKDIQVDFLQMTDEIYIKTPSSINVKQIYLININGQTVGSWNSTNQPLSNEIRIPVKNISEGNYIVKVETNYSSYNKKIIIRY